MQSNYEVGMTFVEEFAITREQVDAFAELSGDYNPLHMDDEFAARTRYGKCIVPGLLLGARISGIIGTKFPGAGTILVSETLTFLKPIYIGDPIMIQISVSKVTGKCLLLSIHVKEQTNNIMLTDGGCTVIAP